MAHFGKHNLSPSAKKLNSAKYDILKTYYLVEGTERLINIFTKLNKVNPDIHIVMSNGGYLSPWWLMYVDAIWLINSEKDASDDEQITKKLVYKDNIYYKTFQIENTQFPLNSVFNHEPKKITTNDNQQEFREYLWMSLSRGTGLIDLYIKAHALSKKEWDVLADGLKWVHKNLSTLSNPKMHGGNPNKNEVYGYSQWNKNGGYISFNNPSDEAIKYEVKLDRKIGVLNDKKTYLISSALNTSNNLVGKEKTYGDIVSIHLQAGQVRVLDFTKN